MRVGGVVIAAGRGWRAPADRYRQALAGKSLALWAAEPVRACCERVVVVVPSEVVPHVSQALWGRDGIQVMAAQPDRWASLRAALDALADYEVVLTHDYFRPFATVELCREVVSAAARAGAAA